MKVKKIEHLRGLKALNARLQQKGFSWQHSDYILLAEVLPEIVRDSEKEEKRWAQPYNHPELPGDWY